MGNRDLNRHATQYVEYLTACARGSTEVCLDIQLTLPLPVMHAGLSLAGGKRPDRGLGDLKKQRACLPAQLHKSSTSRHWTQREQCTAPFAPRGCQGKLLPLAPLLGLPSHVTGAAAAQSCTV